MKLVLYNNLSKYFSNILIRSNDVLFREYCNKPIDLILDGGAFSGSYLLGGLMYLKHISSHINIQRISGTSIGSLFGLLFLSDLFIQYNHKFYRKFRKCFKNNGNLSILYKCLSFIKKNISPDFYLKCNNKLYITYFDVINKKQVVRYLYSSNDDLILCVYKSCFIPFLINGKICYNNQYIDGLVPFIFSNNNNRKVIFMDLHTNYLTQMINIKNEHNNHYRILSGIFETHHFFMYGQSNLCFDLYKHYYYYKTIIGLRQNISVKVVYLVSIIQNLFLRKIKKNNINVRKSNIYQLYSYIVDYFIKHLKKILPALLKCIINSYLV